MIKFFRKLRYKQMGKGKTSKYLKYAIGEIILVVIGILIALQINNWNVSRLETKQEIKILKELANDLQANLIEITDVKEGITQREESASLILRYIKDEKSVNDSVKQAFEHIPIDGIFNNAQTAYKYIENQGINIISNDSLRIAITEIYEKDFLNITRREDYEKDLVLSELLPTITPFLKATPSAWKIPKTDEILFPSVPNYPIDMKSLGDNNVFINSIVHIRNWFFLRKLRLKETVERLEILIEEVKEEIIKLEFR